MLKRINSVYFLADDVTDLEQIKNPTMGVECFVITEACEYRATSDGRWIKQAKQNEGPAGDTDIDLSNYVTKEELNTAIEDTKANTLFGEDDEAMASNPGSQFGLVINKGDTTTIPDAMLKKGIGMYTLWVSKGNPDLPADVIAKNGSVRGLCCVDTVKDTGWYGWILLFDHDGYLYSRYIRNSAPTEWRKCFF